MRFKKFFQVTLVIAPLPLLLLFISLFRPAPADAGNRVPDQSPPLAISLDPPVAEKISFGPLNGLGEREVTGAPGAVLPNGHVLLINLNSSHQDHVLSGPDGSFNAQIYAPPGSAIMVKHGPDHAVWSNVEDGAVGPGWTVFPSTTINIPHVHDADPESIPFAAAGAMDIVDIPPTSIGAAWALTGTVSGVNNLTPGDQVFVESTIRLYSQGINESTDVNTITLQMSDASFWIQMFDEKGNPVPFENGAGSNRLTPGGFPILDGGRNEVGGLNELQPVDWQYVGGNIIEGQLNLTMTLPLNMPSGIYRPVVTFNIDGVPSGEEWISATLSWMSGWPSFNFNSQGLAMPPLQVSSSAARAEGGANSRLIWHLLMDYASLGLRGTGAVEDREIYQASSFVVHQGAPYVVPPVDPVTGNPAVYRLEPYLPMISFGRGAAPGPPLIPFDLPGGELCVRIHRPDETVRDLGCEAFSQAVSGDRSTPDGDPYNLGAIEVSETYGLTAGEGRFSVTFEQSGYHVVEMTGWLEDIWGNTYTGGGSYELWVAHPLDIDPGILPGTPLAVGDPVNTTIQLNPRVPAFVNLTVHHYPFSDPGQTQVFSAAGYANRFGYFAPGGAPITLDQPGEYRVDLFAEYTDPDTGEVYAAGATWGSVVMTPSQDAQLVAHGLRGSDNHGGIPNSWFLFCDPPPPPGNTPHLWNPYLNGDILWSYDVIPDGAAPDCLGDALMMNGSIQDTVGTVEQAITERYNLTGFPVAPPGDFDDRVETDSLPVFSSTTSGLPVALFPGQADQLAYVYFSSQRPGVRVRESVAEDRKGSGYWRLDGMFDNQPGMGFEGDLPNDFKFQYVGIVYRDLETSLSEYLGQGSGWVHLPYSDTVGSRVMPPFSGPGNGGWPTDGGPIMTLKGEDIDMFILPTGVRPGSVLQVGDRFNFAGHLMPTLGSQVLVEVTSPTGQVYLVTGQANPVGYFYAPEHSFIVDEPGRWTVLVQTWHDGQIGSGEAVDCDPADPFDPQDPCPSGDVLGSDQGLFSFYVVSPESERLQINTPVPGKLTFGDQVPPIVINGPIPNGVSDAVVDYTIGMPGFILEEGQAQIAGGQFTLIFDPETLHLSFPNLDLVGRYGDEPGLADTFSFGLLVTGQQGGQPVHRATTLTIQADMVYVGFADDFEFPWQLFLPIVRFDP